MIKKCEFSETQFAFCFTFEILRNNPNLKMPQFPNIVQEGRKGGGYDVMIDGSIFIQFKIPVYRQNKDEYQIKIDTECKQHSLLKELKKPANCVYYAASKFHLLSEFEKYYNENRIEDNAALFSIESFLDSTEVHKHITYTKDSAYGFLHSVDKQISMARGIFPCKSSPSYRPDHMELSKKAKFILKFIQNIDSSVNIKYGNEKIINEVFSILLIQYNILWIPFVDS